MTTEATVAKSAASIAIGTTVGIVLAVILIIVSLPYIFKIPGFVDYMLSILF